MASNSRVVTTLPVAEKTVGPKWDPNTKLGNYDTSRLPITEIVIHTMVGTAVGANARFNDPRSNVSAHYGVLLDGSVWHWVDETSTAYHCGNYSHNQQSIGIEHEDNGNYNGPRTDALYNSSAKLVADLCKYYNILCDRQHVRKHSEIKATDCPDSLDIDRIINQASQLLNPVPKPPQVSPIPSPVVTSDASIVHIGVNPENKIDYGDQEVQAVRSMLFAKDTKINDLTKRLNDIATSATVVNAPLPNLSNEQKGSFLTFFGSLFSKK